MIVKLRDAKFRTVGQLLDTLNSWEMEGYNIRDAHLEDGKFYLKWVSIMEATHPVGPKSIDIRVSSDCPSQTDA